MIRTILVIAWAIALVITLIAWEPKDGKIDPPAIPAWIWWAAL